MSFLWVRIVMIASGIYDGLIGLAFLFAPLAVFRLAAVTPPNHLGYVQFPALVLLIFGAMFLRIAADPVARREQILYGMALKASYFGVVFWYQLHSGIPALWVPFAWADVAFFILFFAGWRATAQRNVAVHSAN
ncbi:MAG TPA: hypothetical protein VGR47_16080 [Terracidiphilus sp.]|nr:hypothetical protein [Terracidiphilus sp.]